MPSISCLIKPASSRCNLRCRYCFYVDEASRRSVASQGVMTEETVQLVVRRLAEAVGYAGNAFISFQGGEPTVAGLDWFRSFVAEMEHYPGVTPHWSIQTNATLLDESWASFFAERHFLVGVSLDGPRSHMDRFRHDPKGDGTFERVMHAIDLLRSAHVEFNILTVVTRQLAQQPRQLMKLYLDHDIAYVQLIPCLPPLDGSDDGMSMRPVDYRRFYLGFFHAWQSAAEQGRLVSVSLFDNVLSMLMGHPTYQCGMIGLCLIQSVVEANGDVYPCDFYCLDENRLGNLAQSSFADLAISKAAEDFIRTSLCQKAPCVTCPYERICSGGCRRQNVCYLTDDTCAHRDVLNQIVPALANMFGIA